MYQTIQSYSHNPGVRGRLLNLSVSSCPVDNNIHEGERVQYSGHDDERSGISGDNGDKRKDIRSYDGGKRSYVSVVDVRRRFSSQETSQYSSCNCGVTVYGDWRGGYRSHTSHDSSHKLGENSILLRLSGALCRVHESIHDN